MQLNQYPETYPLPPGDFNPEAEAPHIIREVCTTFEDEGPAHAAELLKFNRNYRRLTLNGVTQWVRLVGAGQWKLSEETIKFTATEWLINGQHRLTAMATGMSSASR